MAVALTRSLRGQFKDRLRSLSAEDIKPTLLVSAAKFAVNTSCMRKWLCNVYHDEGSSVIWPYLSALCVLLAQTLRVKALGFFICLSIPSVAYLHSSNASHIIGLFTWFRLATVQNFQSLSRKHMITWSHDHMISVRKLRSFNRIGAVLSQLIVRADRLFAIGYPNVVFEFLLCWPWYLPKLLC